MLMLVGIEGHWTQFSGMCKIGKQYSGGTPEKADFKERMKICREEKSLLF